MFTANAPSFITCAGAWDTDLNNLQFLFNLIYTLKKRT